MANFDLEDFLPYRLHQAAELASRRFWRSYKGKYGLTRPEWRVLFNVGQYGPISANEISQRAYLHKTKISRAVAKLEQRRWLRRSEDLADRRRQPLELTPSGRQALDDLRKMASEYDDWLIEAVGRSKAKSLIRTLRAIESKTQGAAGT